jgi:hypothetical protein
MQAINMIITVLVRIHLHNVNVMVYTSANRKHDNNSISELWSSRMWGTMATQGTQAEGLYKFGPP